MGDSGLGGIIGAVGSLAIPCAREHVVAADSQIRKEHPIDGQAPLLERAATDPVVGKVEPGVAGRQLQSPPMILLRVEASFRNDPTEDPAATQLAPVLSREPPAQLDIRTPEERILGNSTIQERSGKLGLDRERPLDDRESNIEQIHVPRRQQARIDQARGEIVGDALVIPRTRVLVCELVAVAEFDMKQSLATLFEVGKTRQACGQMIVRLVRKPATEVIRPSHEGNGKGRIPDEKSHST